MKKYELVTIFRNSIEPSEAQKIIEDSLKKLKGKIEQVNDWGEKKFTFPIKNESSGHYYLFLVSLSPTKVKRLREVLVILNELLRFRIFEPEGK